MVDRVASRFSRAKEASPDSGREGEGERERERERDSEKFRVVYHDSQSALPFSIFIPSADCCTNSNCIRSAREKCFIFPEE